MSSSRNIKKGCDVEMSKAAGASSSDPPAAGAVPAHIGEFLFFQSELAHIKAEETAPPTRGASPGPASPTNDPIPEVLLTRDAVPAKGVVDMDASVLKVEVKPAGSSSTPVHAVDAEPVCESMPSPPPPTKRETVLGLPTPSVAPTAVPKSCKRPSANPDAAKKRRCTKDSKAGPLPAKAYGSGMASRHRANRSREKGRRSLKVIEDAHSLEVTQFESLIGKLEWDLGKTASSLLKAKEVKVAKSSELRRLKHEVKSGEESTACVIEEPKKAVPEEAKLLARKAELVDEDGDFDQILAGLKSECTLSPCPGEPEGQDPIAKEGGGSVVPNPEGVNLRVRTMIE
ncbi:hypothetical protein N665_0067s0031 [Sinapis alba]|nr:hypothetical protein N665_0067s0031 [Sinapis alba]